LFHPTPLAGRGAIVKKVAVMTDSTCCLPPELLSEYHIHVVPLLILHDGDTYRDGIDLPVSEVYQIMRRREAMPTTAVPSPVDFLETYRQLSEKAESILCITVTGTLSGTFKAALLARKMARDEMPNTAIEVIDSRTVAGSMGFIVLEAARAAANGADLVGAREVAQSMIPRVSFVSVIDTLYYLARTGRTGKASAWAASLLNIKPIVEIPTSEGQTVPVERARTRAKAMKRLLEIMAERVGESPVHVMVHHADMPEEAETVRAQIAVQFDCAELHVTEFTPLMGVHTGPGLVGIAFYKDN